MRKNDVNKNTPETEQDDKQLESLIKDRQNLNSALKKILEKSKKIN